MLRVKFDKKDFAKKMNNSIQYSKGFFNGVEAGEQLFMLRLADLAKDSLYNYIDMRARGNPQRLHHVYEPGTVGSPAGRLFTFNVEVSKSKIIFTGSFKQSRKSSDTSKVPFSNKAEIMEGGISITIEPKNAEVLAFEDEGEMVFTRNSITIDHPGGDAVAGSFGETIDEFFLTYFSNAMLAPIVAKLGNAEEFTRNFPAGTKGGGRALGIKTGHKYLDVVGEVE